MSLYKTLGRTPWFSRTFLYQRLFALTAKGLIGGSEPVLAQLRSAAAGMPKLIDGKYAIYPGERAVSSGCIRMTNEDVIDLYNRVKMGAIVVVLAAEHIDSPAPPR